ncbi:hypothetical protein HHI36_015063 [Cryptolaemus montrouzieri]|uniref:Uncharacterized protein n=1 Tax=Cryptolaemus montrouzieri TaxID=559131 RepID=A0ABD2N4V8_9CUCU
MDKTGNIFGKDDMACDVNHDSLFGWPFFDPRDFINTFLRKSARRPIRNRYTTTKPVNITNITLSFFPDMTTFEEAFEKSPLFLTWHHLNDETKIFALGVLQLWQYGGLSFDLVQTKSISEVYSMSTENLIDNDLDQLNTYVDSLLYLGYSNFQMIPGGIVTLAENGCQIETKSACHSFLGKILLLLKCGHRLTSPEDVIKAALKYFLKPPHRSYRRP